MTPRHWTHAHDHPTGAAARRGLERSPFDIRTLGPILIVVFGLVLTFTPMSTAGERNSVGNAGGGSSFSSWGCPTQDEVDELLDRWDLYTQNPSDFFAIPLNPSQIGELVEHCTCDRPFGGNAGGAGIVAPTCEVTTPTPTTAATTTAPPTTLPPTTIPPTTLPAPTSAPPDTTAAQPPDEPSTTPPPETAPPTTQPAAIVTTTEPPDDAADGSGALPPPPPPATGQLPATGSGGPTLATGAGLALVALGCILLVTARSSRQRVARVNES